MSIGDGLMVKGNVRKSVFVGELDRVIRSGGRRENVVGEGKRGE